MLTRTRPRARPWLAALYSACNRISNISSTNVTCEVLCDCSPVSSFSGPRKSSRGGEEVYEARKERKKNKEKGTEKDEMFYAVVPFVSALWCTRCGPHPDVRRRRWKHCNAERTILLVSEEMHVWSTTVLHKPAGETSISTWDLSFDSDIRHRKS